MIVYVVVDAFTKQVEKIFKNRKDAEKFSKSIKMITDIQEWRVE